MKDNWVRTARAVAVMAVLASACDRSTPVATTDSVLQRDLTLASSEFAPGASAMGDTAVATSGRVVPNAPAGVTPRTTAPVRPRAPKKTRVTPAPTAAVPKTVEPAPDPKPVPVAPAPTAPVETPKTDMGVGITPTGATTAGASKSIGRGVALVGKTNAAICSMQNRPGDRLVAVLAEDVVSTDGARLPAGTPILVELAAPANDGSFVFRVKAVMLNGKLVPIDGTVTVDGPTTKNRVSNGGAGTKIAGGAIVGAILGGIFGGGKGAAIGAAGGAVAGTAAAAGSSVTETCLPPGTALTVTLTAPLVLPPGTP